MTEAAAEGTGSVVRPGFQPLPCHCWALYVAMGKLLTSLSSDLSDYRDNGDDKTYFLGSWRIKYDNTHNIHRAPASKQLFK